MQKQLTKGLSDGSEIERGGNVFTQYGLLGVLAARALGEVTKEGVLAGLL